MLINELLRTIFDTRPPTLPPPLTTCLSTSLRFTSFVTTHPATVCPAVVDYSVTASGSPAPTYSYTFSNATVASNSGTGSGNAFNKGTTNVVVTATNVCGAPTCSFSVTVSDYDPPATPAVCPGNQTVHLDNNCQALMPDYRSGLTATDNCTSSGNMTFTQSPAPNSPIDGITPISVTIKAVDEANNMSAVPCAFTVTGLTREINVQGNGVTILDGDNTPNAGDHTNFGGVFPNTNLVRTFTVQNTGGLPLAVSAITSSDNVNFMVGGLSINPIPAGQSATFDVTFNAAIPVAYLSTFTIHNNDCDEGTYDFAIVAAVDCTYPSFSTCPVAPSANTEVGLCRAAVSYAAMATGIPTPTQNDVLDRTSVG